MAHVEEVKAVMSQEAAPEGGRTQRIVRHIGFAERWLARARRECVEGNVTRSLLTLLLAEAEVHHAREEAPRTPGVSRRRSARAKLAGPALLAASGAAVLLLVPTRAPLGPAIADSVTAPPVVRLRHQVGSMVTLVPAVVPAGAESRAGQPADIVRKPPSSSVAVAGAGTPAKRTTRGLRPSSGRAGARPAAPLAAPPGSGRVRATAPRVLSAAELIDLVLTAERSLRGENP